MWRFKNKSYLDLIKAIDIDAGAPFPKYLVDTFVLTPSHQATKPPSIMPAFSVIPPSRCGFVSWCEVRQGASPDLRRWITC